RVFPSDTMAVGDTADVTYSPFGVSTSAGVTPSLSGGMTLLGSVTLSADGPITIGTGGSIAIPNTCRHILIRARVRSTVVAVIDIATVILNNDTTAVAYYELLIGGHGAAPTLQVATTGATAFNAGDASGASDTAAQASIFEVTVYGVNDS